jgi:hypothetical protein
MANQELYQDYFKNWVNVRCNDLQADGALTLPKNSLTSAVESANAVSSNLEHGLITTSALTNAAGATYNITFTNNKIAVNDTVLLSIKSYSGTWGTNGLPYVVCTEVGNTVGQATLRVLNTGTTALAGTVIIEFLVIHNA